MSNRCFNFPFFARQAALADDHLVPHAGTGPNLIYLLYQNNTSRSPKWLTQQVSGEGGILHITLLPVNHQGTINFNYYH